MLIYINNFSKQSAKFMKNFCNKIQIFGALKLINILCGLSHYFTVSFFFFPPLLRTQLKTRNKQLLVNSECICVSRRDKH